MTEQTEIIWATSQHGTLSHIEVSRIDVTSTAVCGWSRRINNGYRAISPFYGKNPCPKCLKAN